MSNRPISEGALAAVQDEIDAGRTTVTALAARIGVHRTTLSRILSGHQPMSIETADRVAMELKLRMRRAIDGDEAGRVAAAIQGMIDAKGTHVDFQIEAGDKMIETLLDVFG